MVVTMRRIMTALKLQSCLMQNSGLFGQFRGVLFYSNSATSYAMQDAILIRGRVRNISLEKPLIL